MQRIGDQERDKIRRDGGADDRTAGADMPGEPAADMTEEDHVDQVHAETCLAEGTDDEFVKLPLGREFSDNKEIPYDHQRHAERTVFPARFELDDTRVRRGNRVSAPIWDVGIEPSGDYGKADCQKRDRECNCLFPGVVRRKFAEPQAEQDVPDKAAHIVECSESVPVTFSE